MSNENPFASPNPDAPTGNSDASGNPQAQPASPMGQSYPATPDQPNVGAPMTMAETPKTTNSLAVPSLVLGITSIVIPFLGILLGIIGGVLGGMGISKATKLPGNPGKTMSIVGVVLSVLGFVLWVAVTAFMVWVLMQAAELMNDPEFMEQVQEMQNSQQ